MPSYQLDRTLVTNADFAQFVRARNAEKFGARTGRPGSSIMQPAAAGGRSADGEDDKEHVRRYGIDAGDVFDDERAVAPESIGDEPDDH